LTTAKHTLVVLNPGHFHAALTLRKTHPRLADDVYVYSEDGPDLDRFLRIVQTFNERAVDPTRWKLHIYRGADYLDRLRVERPGRVVIVAGRNDTKMAAIHRLHADGFCVLGDKPWTIGTEQLAMLRDTVHTPPLVMDIMTERSEIANRVQKALIQCPEVFGNFRSDGNEPAIYMRSVHHLYKVVNQQPLVRPAWYFDIAAQGEGVTDVPTHLVDLAQWMTGGARPFDYERDVELLSARQWPTDVPLETFTRITGLREFPESLRSQVANGVLRYLCNAEISYRLRGIPVRLESVWDLAIPLGGGDTHHAILRGSKADLVVDQGPATHFKTELVVRPAASGSDYLRILKTAIASLQGEFPGLALERTDAEFRVTIPLALRTTHEEHFAAVLDQFLGYLDDGQIPGNCGPDLIAKYTLLADAGKLSHRES
jgi:predicted dehydrogenase